MTHKALEAHVAIGATPVPVTSFVMDGANLGIPALAHAFAAFAETLFDLYCTAVLTDFP